MSRPTANDPLHLTQREYDEMVEFGEGLCLRCGTHTGTIELDARRYPCPVCHRDEVYGIEQVLLMGIVVIDGGDDAPA